jgi:hypothetical protein
MKKIVPIIKDISQNTNPESEITAETGFYSLISDKKAPEPQDNQLSGLYSLVSDKKAPEPLENIPSGLYSLISDKIAKPKSNNLKDFQPDGLNTFVLSNGESYTYNDFSFDKTTVKLSAPIDLNKGWFFKRESLKTFESWNDDYLINLENYKELVKDNPDIKKPTRDFRNINQTDTEFNFWELALENQDISELLTQEVRTHHTTQIKTLPGKDGIAPNIIFATKRFAQIINPILKEKGYSQLPVLTEKHCDVIDYYNLITNQTWEVKTAVVDGYLNSLPKFFLTISAHNAEAELNLIFHNQLNKRLKELQAGYSNTEGIIKQSKVLKCFSTVTNFGVDKKVDWVSLKAIVSIDGEEFHLCLQIIDTIKMHGIVSLGNFAKASGFDLNEKDLLSKKDKSDIEATAIERIEDFIAYSLGDTQNLEIAFAFAERTQEMYAEMNLENYTAPALSIGRTVVDLDFAVISEALGFVGKGWSDKINDFVKKEIEPQSPKETIKNSTHSRSILAKGFGGRIGQNQPTLTSISRTFKKDLRNRQDYGIELKNPDNAKFKTRKIKGKFDSTIIVDIDISGCYAESQRVQVLPIGKPIVGGLNLNTTSKNNYPKLGNFLTDCKVDIQKLSEKNWTNYEEYQKEFRQLWGELDLGTFVLFIEVAELKEICDLFPSWIHPSKGTNHKILCKLLADAAKGDDSAIKKIKQGVTKKLLNQIEITPINFDCLEWIFFMATRELRKELLQKASVIAFVIYPASYRITSDKTAIRERIKDCQEQLNNIRDNWKPTNDLVLKFKDNFALYGENYRDCHAWYGETIGDLILNKLITKRKIAQWIKKKSPADLLYKLFNNTHFGVSISPLFAISNICVGNNITARCRVLAWTMEKALLGMPTITDGCFYELNRVLGQLLSHARAIASNCVNMDSKNSPLGHRHYLTKAQPYNFEFNDRNFTYSAITTEYVMKNKRIYSKCEIIQTSKIDKSIKNFESLLPLDRIVTWEKGKAIKLRIMDILAEQAKQHIQQEFPFLSVVWMKATSIKVKAKKPEYDKLNPSEKSVDLIDVFEKDRYGLADLEIKDYHHAVGNHGMANYALVTEKAYLSGKGVSKKENESKVEAFIKENKKSIGWREVVIEESENTIWEITIKDYVNVVFRGNESSKPHVAVISFDNKLEKHDRYHNDHPAKDFMKNLLVNDNKIPRQFTAIKGRSISCGDYKNNPKKFDAKGFSAGDMLKIAMLFTEFAPSQFNYKNKEQIFGWDDDVKKSKEKYGQSIEAWFINSDGTLRFRDMVLWAADAIERGVKSPIKELSSYGQRSKPKVGSPTTKLKPEYRYHPEWFVFQKVKNCLDLSNLELSSDDSESDYVESVFDVEMDFTGE